MENYKQAVFNKLRFQIDKGLISVSGVFSTEQLCDLDERDLDALAVHLETECNQSARKSFLVQTTEKDDIAKLKFEIVLDILNTKVQQRKAANEEKEIRKHNRKIDMAISEKEEEAFKGKTIDELMALYK